MYALDVNCRPTLLLATVALVGCSNSHPARDPHEFVWATRTPIVTLDPAAVSDQVTADALRQVYECLVTVDDNGKIKPGLAKAWEWSAGRKLLTLHLQTGVKFSNGQPLTAVDVVNSLNRAINVRIGGGLARDYLQDVKGAADSSNMPIPGVIALDSQTIGITLTHHSNSFLPKLSYPALAIVYQPLPPFPILKVDQMIGTGPFKAVSFTEGSELNLESRPDYWGGRPGIDRVKILCLKDDQTRISLLNKGQVDLGYVPPTEVRPFSQNPRLHITPLAQVGYLLLNPKTFPPLADRRVRLALAMAIDRPRLVRDVLGDVFELAQGVVPPSLAGRRPRSLMPEFNPSAAQRLLAEAGYPSGKGFPQIKVSVAKKGHPDVTAEAIATDWRTNLGVDASVAEGSSNDLVERAQRGELPFYVTGWSGDYADLGNFVPMLFASHSSQNLSEYRNSRVDDLIGLADVVSDDAQRKALLTRAEALVLADMPIIPLYHKRDPELTSPNFTQIPFTPYGHLSLVGVRPVGR